MFTAECYAVCVAVSKIISDNIESSIIYTNSLSLLAVLHIRNAVELLVGSIIHHIEKVTTQGHMRRICWVSCHVAMRADVCAVQVWKQQIKYASPAETA